MVNTGTIYQESSLQLLKAIKELEKIQKNSRTICFGKSIWVLYCEMIKDIKEHNLIQEYFNQEIIDIDSIDYHNLKLVFPKYKSMPKKEYEEWTCEIRKQKGSFEEWRKKNEK